MSTAAGFITLPGEYDYSTLEQQFEEMLPTLIQFGIVAAVLLGVFLLLFYLLLSISIYTMAERRGIAGAFCAWIPFLRWIVLGRVASDIYLARTGKHAVYGTLIAVTFLIPLVMAIGAAIYCIPTWILSIASLSTWLCRVIRLFALSEIYRDYSRHWVGLLIFNVMFFWLTPIFMIAVHKHTPETVRRSYAAQHRRAVVNVPEGAPDTAEPETEPEAAPEPAPLVTPAPQDSMSEPVAEPAAEAADAPADIPTDAPADAPVDTPAEPAQDESSTES